MRAAAMRGLDDSGASSKSGRSGLGDGGACHLRSTEWRNARHYNWWEHTVSKGWLRRRPQALQEAQGCAADRRCGGRHAAEQYCLH